MENLKFIEHNSWIISFDLKPIRITNLWNLKKISKPYKRDSLYSTEDELKQSSNKAALYSLFVSAKLMLLKENQIISYNKSKGHSNLRSSNSFCFPRIFKNSAYSNLKQLLRMVSIILSLSGISRISCSRSSKTVIATLKKVLYPSLNQRSHILLSKRAVRYDS